MSRSGYSDDCDDQWASICWRGAVASAIRGKRGQDFLRELLRDLDAMPDKRLIDGELIAEGQVCAIGSVGRARGVDMTAIDPEDFHAVARTFGISRALAQEIEFMNDEAGSWRETPEQRWTRMRQWVASEIKQDATT